MFVVEDVIGINALYKEIDPYKNSQCDNEALEAEARAAAVHNLFLGWFFFFLFFHFWFHHHVVHCATLKFVIITEQFLCLLLLIKI